MNNFLKKSRLTANFNGLEYRFSQNDNLGYSVYATNSASKEFWIFDIKLMPDGKDETILPYFKITSPKSNISQIILDSMPKISEYLKNINFDN
ncbi:MAG TPA: hypothetical protein PLG05_09025 [Bacteroidales bacterium]|jgi:hypothetical protein|nr:hypothetical protein [Bacteroidales bacterium]